MTSTQRGDANPVPLVGGCISTRIVSARPSPAAEAFVPPPAVADTLARIFIVVPWTAS